MVKYLIFVPMIVVIVIFNLPFLFLFFLIKNTGIKLGIELWEKYGYALMLSLDQYGNALSFGDIDETISSRVGRRWPDSWLAKAINALFWWEPNHVQNSIEPDEGKNDLIK